MLSEKPLGQIRLIVITMVMDFHMNVYDEKKHRFNHGIIVSKIKIIQAKAIQLPVV